MLKIWNCNGFLYRRKAAKQLLSVPIGELKWEEKLFYCSLATMNKILEVVENNKAKDIF